MNNLHPIMKAALAPFIPSETPAKAFVSANLNFKDDPCWGAVVPGKSTTWHDTEKKAQVLVDEYNNRRSDYFETSQAQES